MSLRWGIIGPGVISTRRFAPALVEAGHPIVGAWGRTLEKTRQFTERFGGVAHASLTALLDDPEVEAVYIATPNHQHAEQTIAAARAGKHVLCEKPMAPTLAECDAMIAACNEAGVVLGVAHHMRFFGPMQEARRLVAEGVLGRPLIARAEITYDITRSVYGASPDSLRLNRAIGGGIGLDVGTHCLDTLRYVLDDEVIEVTGMHDSPVLGVSGDERFLALARFDRGCMGIVYNAAVIPVSRNDYQIAGTLGTLVVENGLGQEDLGVLRLRLAGESEWRTVETRRQNGYVGEIRAFTAAVREGTPLGIDGVNGRANVAIVLAALEAGARRGFAEVR